ncbi:MAG: DUF5060 domain-containing protein [Rhodothermales bacterium]
MLNVLHRPPVASGWLTVFILLWCAMPSRAGAASFDDAAPAPDQQAVTVTGELKKWHTVTLTFDGPSTSETASPNPFRNYRLNVTFTKGSKTYVVPGYYAADGNAGETSATSGAKWRVHFTPDETGTWNYSVSFVTGTDIAVSTSAGTPTSFNGTSGSFTIAGTDKTGDDFRARGRLRYAGKHYMKLDNGDWFIENGSGSPENLLGDPDFDGTFNFAGDHLKTYSAHIQDWKTGDPSWKGGKGKGIVGAMNYLAGEGINSQFFITMNVEGDGKDVWPWTAYEERYRFDVSKLDQWEILFTHMNNKGILLHVVLQELGNEFLLDGGDLGLQRKLYYREMIARFGHHNLKWNLGEEHKIEGIGNTDAQRIAFTGYINANDPYKSIITMHSQAGTDKYLLIYGPLLGNPAYSGISFQIHDGEWDVAGDKTYNRITEWRDYSTDAGRPWIITLDECCGWNGGVRPDESNMEAVRKSEMWGSLMAGGAGFDWYLGFDVDKRDLELEDFRRYDFLWEQSTIAHTFFTAYLPFQDMEPKSGLAPLYSNRVFAKTGSIYAVYLPNGGTTTLDLGATVKTYPVQWYNPRTGGALKNGTVTSVSGPGVKSIGSPPSETTKDWVAIVGDPLDGPVDPPPPPPPPSTAGAFLESGGQVVIEAEHYAASIPRGGQEWLLKSDKTGFSGDGAMAALPDLNKNLYSFVNTSPEMIFDVSFGTTGTYYVWLRMWANNADDNRVHVGLNGQSSNAASFMVTNTYNTWTWTRTRLTSSTATLGVNSAGTHTINVWMQKDEAYVDKIVLTTDAGFTPTGAGPAESPREGGEDPPPPPGDAPAVTSLTLINAVTDLPIAGYDPIPAGATLNLATLPTRSLNIRANVNSLTKSLIFGYDTNDTYRKESLAPFAIGGDASGNYSAWTPATGSHEVRATPYGGTSFTGAVGATYSLSFSVIDPSSASKTGAVDASLAMEAVPLVFAIESAYPNPFTERGEVVITVDRDQVVQVSLYDVLGREIGTLFAGTLEAGVRHRIAVDGASLAPGLFVVRARGETEALQRMLVHAR